ncbi:MAG TPA: DUF488 domain-containing protein [Xanthobacteraceae bacterium]|jgi:uncharacterized protein (DUF488 family)|nr:DUF488 domain-containing protein [Xanthobacteraceae bacterium]
MNVADSTPVLTIGHSVHPWETFLVLLRRAGVTAIADVRTSPYSRHNRHFNRDELRRELNQSGISYVFLGNELGGRPTDPELYSDGVVDYEKMAKAKTFSSGLDRVVEGTKKYRIALMCSEQDPLDCHRCLLVSRALTERGIVIKHILGHGEIVDHLTIEEKLLEISNRNDEELFDSRAERLAAAYRHRARNVAFAEPAPDTNEPVAAE